MAPFLSWATAATNIQAAIDAADEGAKVWISNGVFRISEPILVRRGLTISSVEGPSSSVVNGQGRTPGFRLYHSNAVLRGISIQGCIVDRLLDLKASEPLELPWSIIGGGAVFSRGAKLIECRLEGSAIRHPDSGFTGLGAYMIGGALVRCSVTGGLGERGVNTAGVYATSGAQILDSVIMNNGSECMGGGITIYDGVVSNCVVMGNRSEDHGGGIYAVRSTILRSVIATNRIDGSYPGLRRGAGVFLEDGAMEGCITVGNVAQSIIEIRGSGVHAIRSTIRNCLILGNSAIGVATRAAGGGGFFSESTIDGCTFVRNQTDYPAWPGGAPDGWLIPIGGGVYSDRSLIRNSIIFHNTSDTNNNWFATNSTFLHVCSAPRPPGFGNFNQVPQFRDLRSGDLRLSEASPCINAGIRSPDLGLLDLDGLPRVIADALDLGAYEYPAPRSLISHAWLKDRNLPLDGSADFLDPDRDNATTYQEWRSGTEPLNPHDVLRLGLPARSSTQLTLQWQAPAGQRIYVVERASRLLSEGGFVEVGRVPFSSSKSAAIQTVVPADSIQGINGYRLKVLEPVVNP